MARASERPGGLDGSANAILLEAASLSRHPAAPLTPPPRLLPWPPGPDRGFVSPGPAPARRAPPAPVGSPAVSRTHSAVFSRAIKRQRKMDHRGWKWGEVPLDLRCARGDDLKRFSHLLFRSRAGGMNTPRAAILRISAPARGAGLRWPEAGAPAPTSGLAEGGGAAGKQTRAAPQGAPCQRAVPQGWLGLA